MPMLLFYLPLIIVTGMFEAMLTADDLEAVKRAPDPDDQMLNPRVVPFPTAARG
ncbi:MAG TPA: hypothetical protein VJR71_03990 [Pseudolabrys sp.]|nr:hypothetical protein [Pseudolabrys sp.]